ncbi:twin-arginine translocation signal domain-containing protein [Halodesulfurarchaeum sp.]|uniref:twin-arginine translocation signal domain-containing protein n=1 Tax=Halodesulfurarchaeum sp. TaxID=1980530 RepID=UPI002FC3BC40
MNRRRFLAGVGAAGTVAFAGCAGPVGTTELSDPEVDVESAETHLTYRDNEGRIATTTVQYGPVRPDGLVRMRISIWHRKETAISDLFVTFRNRAPTGLRPSVYVGGFSGEFPPIDYQIDDESDGRLISVPDLSPVGEGTVTLELYVQAFDDWPLELTVDVAYGLDAGVLQSYAVEGTTDLSIPNPESGES